MNKFITPVSEFAKGILIGGMIVAAMIWAIVLLSGCSTKSYTSPEGARITSTTFVYGPELTGLRAADGNRTLEIEGQKSDLGNALSIIKALTVKP